MCNNDQKYRPVKRKLAASAHQSETVIVSTIAVAIAGGMGTAAGVLVPLVAICLIAVCKMGVEAFCKAESFDVRISTELRSTTDRLSQPPRSKKHSGTKDST